MLITTMFLIIVILLIVLFVTYLIISKYQKHRFNIIKKDLILCKFKNKLFFSIDNQTNKEDNKIAKVTFERKLEQNQNMFYSKLLCGSSYLKYDGNNLELTNDRRESTTFRIISDDNSIDILAEDEPIKVRNYFDDSLVICTSVNCVNRLC